VARPLTVRCHGRDIFRFELEAARLHDQGGSNASSVLFHHAPVRDRAGRYAGRHRAGQAREVEDGSRARVAGQSQHRDDRAVAGPAGRRRRHGKADRRSSPEERRLQEDRRAHEHQGHRREELLEAQADGYGDARQKRTSIRQERTAVAAAGAWPRGQVPMPLEHNDAMCREGEMAMRDRRIRAGDPVRAQRERDDDGDRDTSHGKRNRRDADRDGGALRCRPRPGGANGRGASIARGRTSIRTSR